MLGTKSKTYDELKKALFVFFTYYDKNLNDETCNKIFQLYFEKLKIFDEIKIVKRLEDLIYISNSKFLPKIAEIVSPFLTNKQDEIALKWVEFRGKMNNNLRYEKIPDWVYTIKKHLGIARCNDMTKDNLIWLNKDFVNAYDLFTRGQLEVIKEPVRLNGFKKKGVVPIKNVLKDLKLKVLKGD